MMRRETKQVKLEVEVLKRCPEDRYVKLCYKKIVQLASSSIISTGKKLKYNWVTTEKYTEKNRLLLVLSRSQK